MTHPPEFTTMNYINRNGIELRATYWKNSGSTDGEIKLEQVSVVLGRMDRCYIEDNGSLSVELPGTTLSEEEVTMLMRKVSEEMKIARACLAS